MDLCRDLSVSVSGVFPTEYMPESGNSSLSGSSASLDDLFLPQNAEGDMNLEWLSIFVEDCLSSSTDYLSNPLQNSHTKPSENNKKLEVIIPSKVRSKRKRSRTALNNNKSHAEFTQKPFSYMDFSDTLLLNQTQWLAESELVVFKKESRREREEEETVRCPETVGNVGQIRRCAHCLSHRTPQWRAGPLGPKTLCNACGVRYKSGRLLPEYRPAKSPTFVSYKHSNSHKKVMEMRMSIVSPVQTD